MRGQGISISWLCKSDEVVGHRSKLKVMLAVAYSIEVQITKEANKQQGMLSFEKSQRF